MTKHSELSKMKTPYDIDHGTFTITGMGGKTVRLCLSGESNYEIGFATTTYSHSLSEEMKGYAASRISLSLMAFTGMSNDAIYNHIERNIKRNSLHVSGSKFKLGTLSVPEICHELDKMQRCLNEIKDELGKDSPNQLTIRSLLQMSLKPAHGIINNIEQDRINKEERRKRLGEE